MYRIYIAYILILLIVGSVSAQDNTQIFLKGIPQNNIMNPAFRPVDGWYIAMPALGGVQINGENSGFSWNDIIRPDATSDSTVIDLDYAAGQLQDLNTFATEATLQVLGLGFSVREHTFLSFEINHRLKARANYPKALFDLRNGNWNYEGNAPINHDLSDMYVHGVDYNEIAFGWSRILNSKFTIGARAKIILGVAHVESEYVDAKFITEENSLVSLQSSMAVRTNLPLDIGYDDEGYVSSVELSDSFGADDFLSTKNKGFAFDFGVTYQATEKLLLGASVIDVGSISWTTETTQLSTSGTFLFEGVDVSDEITGEEGGEDDYWAQLEADFKEAFKVEDANEVYSTGLMGNFNVSAFYQFQPWLNFGVLSKNYVIDELFLPEASFSVGLSHRKVISSAITYTMKKNAPSNLGTGISVRAGAFQFYAVTDNLLSLFDPENAQYVNGRIGINLIFDKKKEEL
ncbi:DUF5723 family protein [Carboxylicivirga sp. M1479]|uniref:DUF5723 family protein n=1 Tax=Carboxylicivirga sp. M1479 TaxID=2594476 RepID=UPI0011786AA1|nr:DUF5723 family protein [Carboxylicivirga sp. M1479]TRX63297.1 hypothetical protein FNN09_18780 [Carboxylicivirga sp. M1479]